MDNHDKDSHDNNDADRDEAFPVSGPGPAPGSYSRANDDPFLPLRRNPVAFQKVIHSLMNGKHIDPYLPEEFRFLENYPAAWEDFFQWLGYRLRRSELGGNPFFYLDAAADPISRGRLSRGATFLGLYLSWYFFMLGPGEADRITTEEIFQRLVSSYPFHFLRAVFVRRMSGPSPLELSEDQAEKLRGYIRRELAELAKYRFVDIRPHPRANWQDLTVHRLPALYRFWELALHVRARSGGGSGAARGGGDGGDGSDAADAGRNGGGGNGIESDIDDVVAEVWGSVEPEAEEDDQ